MKTRLTLCSLLWITTEWWGNHHWGKSRESCNSSISCESSLLVSYDCLCYLVSGLCVFEAYFIEIWVIQKPTIVFRSEILVLIRLRIFLHQSLVLYEMVFATMYDFNWPIPEHFDACDMCHSNFLLVLFRLVVMAEKKCFDCASHFSRHRFFDDLPRNFLSSQGSRSPAKSFSIGMIRLNMSFLLFSFFLFFWYWISRMAQSCLFCLFNPFKLAKLNPVSIVFYPKSRAILPIPVIHCVEKGCQPV